MVATTYTITVVRNFTLVVIYITNRIATTQVFDNIYSYQVLTQCIEFVILLRYTFLILAVSVTAS